MSFTFAQLKTAIQDYTDNSETAFVTHLSDFIKSAEERIFKNVDLETDHETYMKLILNKRIANQYRRKEKLLNYNKKVFNALQRILDV